MLRQRSSISAISHFAGKNRTETDAAVQTKDRSQARPAHVGINDANAGSGLGQTKRGVYRGRGLPFARQTGSHQQSFGRAARQSKARRKYAGAGKIRPAPNGRRRSSAIQDCSMGGRCFHFVFARRPVWRPTLFAGAEAGATAGMTASAGRCSSRSTSSVECTVSSRYSRNRARPTPNTSDSRKAIITPRAAIWPDRSFGSESVVHHGNVVGVAGQCHVVFFRTLQQIGQQSFVGFDLLLNDVIGDGRLVLGQRLGALLIERFAQRFFLRQRLPVTGFEIREQIRRLVGLTLP